MSKTSPDSISIADANQQRGFEGKLFPGPRPALLLIDFVQAYLEPTSPLYAGVELARDSSQQLLNACRSGRIPVIHTNVAYEKGGRDGGVFFRKVPALTIFEKGVAPELTRFAKGLEPEHGEVVITKQHASAFFGTRLSSILTAEGIDTLILAGVSTSGCVRATAVDCCQHGFIPLVVRDAVGDRTAHQHDSNLFDIQTKYGEVISLAAALDYVAQIGRMGHG